jgi:hypothetical protein
MTTPRVTLTTIAADLKAARAVSKTAKPEDFDKALGSLTAAVAIAVIQMDVWLDSGVKA